MVDHKNQIVGMFGFSMDITAQKTTERLKVILDFHDIKFGKQHQYMNIAYNPSTIKLTELERDVLFCIYLGINSRKDVAYILTVIYKKLIYAETTVNDAFRRLYQKLDCNNPTQLLEFATVNNLFSQIPSAFLPAR